MKLYILYARTHTSNGMFLVGRFTRWRDAQSARHHVVGLIDHQVTTVILGGAR